VARQIVLDTETTGLEPELGHRIIEIGCVELVDRRRTDNDFHQYFNPEREIDEAAREVHGITEDSLANKPRFGDVASVLIDYLHGAELIIHNAEFDLSFLNAELGRIDAGFNVQDHCAIIDTLSLARRLHPGARNSLDGLCRRFDIDNSQRTQHGALLDAELLAEVYLAMTGGQTTFLGESEQLSLAAEHRGVPVPIRHRPTRVIHADDAELAAHAQWVRRLDEALGRPCGWHGGAGSDLDQINNQE